MKKTRTLSAILVSLIMVTTSSAQVANKPLIIAYYSGDELEASKYPVEKLTHIIFSFCHMKGDRLNVDNAQDSATIRSLVALRKRNPELKVLLSLGGWGGCASCSEVFESPRARRTFAESVKELNEYFNTDGIDLDWEYPAIEGYPGHRFKAGDKENFTKLVKVLREVLGTRYEISFAAGGFNKFLEQSVEWKQVMPLVDRVNLMTYDLVSGFDTVTGHHTPLYSNPRQKESTDNAVKFLTSMGIPSNKLVIGAAFYARVWENASNANNGLYQVAKFKSSVPFKRLDSAGSLTSSLNVFYDSTSKSPYRYHSEKKLFATYDDKTSLKEKARYVRENKLNGIMFWELTQDMYSDGLLDTIYSELRQ
jgi:chitinase